MKVTRPGNLKVEPAPWWVGKTVECSHCGCRAELEAHDGPPLVQAHAERHPGGRQWVEIKCPTQGCPGNLTTTKV